MPRGNFLKAQLFNQPFIVQSEKLQTYINVLNNEVPKMESNVEIANNNVKYSILGDIAVISIDGAMHKKNMNGACGESVVSYPDINNAIDKAESDVNVKTILFRVDTPGGSVAGAEETRYKIKNSSKKTVTFYENLGASGGMWIFTASDELYAAPTTWLGSIGVVVQYKKMSEDGIEEYETITSESAPNKRAKNNEDLRSQLISMVNEIENDFFAVLKENTGYEKDFLVETFNNGGIIKAEIAKEKGFIKDISHFSVLLSNLKSNTGVSMPEEEKKPTVNTEPKVINGLAFTEENFKVQMESRTKSQETIKTLTDNVAANANIMEKFENFKASISTRVALAMSYGISDAEVITNIISADDEKEAVTLAIAAKEEKTIVVVQGDNNISSQANGESDIMAYAKKNKGSIK